MNKMTLSLNSKIKLYKSIFKNSNNKKTNNKTTKTIKAVLLIGKTNKEVLAI
jgi:hypothetical protein